MAVFQAIQTNSSISIRRVLGEFQCPLSLLWPRQKHTELPIRAWHGQNIRKLLTHLKRCTVLVYIIKYEKNEIIMGTGRVHNQRTNRDAVSQTPVKDTQLKTKLSQNNNYNMHNPAPVLENATHGALTYKRIT